MIAALFPGQGSQTVGMAKDLYGGSAAAKAVLDEAEAALPGLLALMWEGPADVLGRTANQQPALVAAGVVMSEFFMSRPAARALVLPEVMRAACSRRRRP